MKTHKATPLDKLVKRLTSFGRWEALRRHLAQGFIPYLKPTRLGEMLADEIRDAGYPVNLGGTLLKPTLPARKENDRGDRSARHQLHGS